METLQFEAVKVAMKQNKDGYGLTLNVHPDEVPDALLRDFVGARYQVVMVRLADDDTPMDRREHDGSKALRLSGVLCRESDFWEFLADTGEIFDATEESATDWLRGYLGVSSRADLKVNQEAREKLQTINKAYREWLQK